ncbi:MAG: hypothetical protein KGR42_06825 [Acidobacteria bacterium]|nr:hypothetical protein [Acidobacteriota bacterium]
MMKILVSLATVSLVGATVNIAAAAISPPPSVTALTGAETHVVTLLHQFKNTATWKKAYEAAVATQSADIAKLNAALSPAPASGKLFSQSGSGAQTTGQFTVPASAKGWRIAWAYNCSSFGSSGNFIISVYQGASLSFNDPGVVQLGVKGSGTEHNYDTGTFHLGIDSECAWTVSVIAGP